MGVDPKGTTEADRVRRLLGTVEQLTRELHPRGAHRLDVNLDSDLDHDLGFDSLSRVELMLRVEREFAVSLAQGVLGTAETPRDLLRALLSAKNSGEAQLVDRLPMESLERAEGVPRTAGTLPEVLEWHLQVHPRRTHVYLYGEADAPEEISYQALYQGAEVLAAGLQQRGLLPGQSVAIMLPTGREYLYSFFAVLLAGGVPVPVYPPVRPSQLEDHLRRHAAILGNAQAQWLITVPEAKAVARLLQAQVQDLRGLVTAEELAEMRVGLTSVIRRPRDIAFLQYTSGSTGAPKGVVLTHANLLSNIRAMGEVVEADSSDVFVSWLPLYHDMGLIGAWLGSLYYAMPLVLMSPLAFLASPKRWLWTIHRHRGTLSAAPNFAYELCLAKLQDEDLEGLDLSSWRMAFNGAEPVSPQALRRFGERFSRYALKPQTLSPVYGLAEAAVGLAFPPPGRGPLIDRVRREPFAVKGEAVAAESSDLAALEFAACGQPLPGYQIRVVDPADRELPERREGRVQFRGPSATSGYFRNPEATRGLFHGDWLETGDRGYIAAGDIYITGRIKDVIIRGGRNLYPYEVEEAVGEIPGVRKGCVAVFGSTDSASGTERLVVVAESREKDSKVLEELESQVRSVTSGLLGMPPEQVVLAPPHSVLKTSSGKIRRGAVRDLYEQGQLGRGPRAVWWQLLRLTLASLGPRWRGLRRRLSDLSYAAYAHLVFWLLAPPVWVAIALLPGLGRRWALMRGAARLLFRLTGVPIRVEGLQRLPRGQTAVLVVNHASYLDGVVLVATLPAEVSFIAKQELERQLVPRVFLRRIGAAFVERFDLQQGVADARRIQSILDQGRSLLYFPEGTLTRAPGLLPFHMGAFVAAAGAGVPVVPVTLRGTRSLLRGNSLFPHRGTVSVHIAEPVLPEGDDWAAAVQLRDATRSAMLRHLGEPDLAASGSAG